MNFNEFDIERGPQRLDLNQYEFSLIFDGKRRMLYCACCFPLEKLAI